MTAVTYGRVSQTTFPLPSLLTVFSSMRLASSTPCQIPHILILSPPYVGYAYCIRAGDYVPPTPTSSLPPTTPTGPPAETHTGQPANCNQWHVVEDGDGCDTIEAEYGLTPDQFFGWNPAVSRDCLTNFWLGYAYCVGVSSSASPPTTTTTPTTTSSPTTTPAIPSPVQDGNAVDNCNAYAQAQDGDWCAAFAERNGVREVDLYAWNTVLGASGENCASSFWGGYWYCIGVAAARKQML